jgi:hypothetical protein
MKLGAFTSVSGIICIVSFHSSSHLPSLVIIVESKKLTLQLVLKVEERTCAMTPDKMDRTARGVNVGTFEMPYPLVEEEATPTVPESEWNQSI